MSTLSWDISVQDDGTTLVVRPIGEIDMYTAAQVDACLRGCSNGHKAIVLDVSQIHFMDSAGVQMLVETQRREEERFVLQGTSPPVERLLEVTGIARMFRRSEDHGTTTEPREAPRFGVRRPR